MKMTITFTTALTTGFLAGQNLVPNGSFEEYTECPSNFSQIERATGWMPFRVTPDYYNACSTPDSAGVPLNILGYQAAATGAAYAGMWCYFDKYPTNGREYMGIQLSQPLVPGTEYNLSFRTVFASSGSPDGYLPQYNCSGIGLRFVLAPFFEGGGWPVPNNAAIYLDHLVTDTVSWTTVAGTYVPDSAYAYLVVGNFFDDQTILVNQFDPSGNFDGAYFYVDDVCVTEGTSGCDFTGIRDVDVEPISLSPNPCEGDFRINGFYARAYNDRLMLRDMVGRECMSLALPPDGEPVHLPAHLASGTYLVSLETTARRIDPLRLVLQRP